MSDFQQVFSESGKAPLFRSLLNSHGLGRSPPLTLAFGLIPGLPRLCPRTPLSLPGVGGRLHGDGSARVLLHLLIAEFRGEGHSGGSVSREVRVHLCVATEDFIAFRRCFLPLSPARLLPPPFLPGMGEAGFLGDVLAQALQEPKSCLFSCAWGFVALLFPQNKGSDPCRALAGERSGVLACYGWCVFTLNHLPSFSKCSSAAEIVAFPACSSRVACKTKELSLCVHNMRIYMCIYMYLYTYLCICALMKSMSAVPASGLLLCDPVCNGMGQDGTGQDGMGWGAGLGLPPVPALQLFLFSPLPEDAPFYTARQPCL